MPVFRGQGPGGANPGGAAGGRPGGDVSAARGRTRTLLPGEAEAPAEGPEPAFRRLLNQPSAGDLTSLPQVSEHVAARFVVHLGLEGELVLQGDGTLGGGAGADLVDEPLDVRKPDPGVIAQDVGHHARPAPQV